MINGCLPMYFQTLYYPSHTFCYVNANRALRKTRLNPPLAITPSSVVTQTDSSDSFSNTIKNSCSITASEKRDSVGSLLSQANTVGIIGGVSADATLNFLRKLVQWSSEDGQSNIPFVLCSDPELNKELLSFERSSYPSLRSRNEKLEFNDTLIVENLLSKRKFLENSGARCIVMPCHICHSWHDEISKGSSIPFLHVGDCVARELKDAKLKPLEAGSPLRIGLLATNVTLISGFYQERLQKEGFEVVVPDKATIEHTIVPAIEATDRKDIEGAQNLMRIALRVLLVSAVNVIILASDEMRTILPPDDPLLKKCIDPMDALAKLTVRWVQSNGKSA